MHENLIVSDEVRAALGEDLLRAIEGGDPEYRCAVCRVDGNWHNEATSVLATNHADGGQRISMAHHSCIPSVVATSDEPLGDLPFSTDEGDVISLAVIVPTAQKPRPYLIVHRRMAQKMMISSGDQIDPVTASLLEQGWSLAPGMPAKFPQPRGWRLELTESGEGRVVDGAGSVLLDRLPSLPPGWDNLARRGGTVTVLTGEVGLSPDLEDSAQIVAAIQEACLRGRVVGARLGVTRVSHIPGETSDDSFEATSKRLADALGTALRTRADPAGTDNLNSAPSVVPLPTRPTLTPFLMEQEGGAWPVVVVDLNDPEEPRAAGTLDKFAEVGMNVDRQLGSNIFPMPPEGWSHVTWDSQILVLAGRDDSGEMRKVFFEPCAFPQGWLDAARTSPYGSLGLIVGNNFGPWTAVAKTLEAKSSAGALVVCTLSGMMAGTPDA